MRWTRFVARDVVRGLEDVVVLLRGLVKLSSAWRMGCF